MTTEKVTNLSLCTTETTTKTCANCKLVVAQPPGTRRTLCPGCGAFYDAAVANQVRTFQNNRLTHTNEEDLRGRYEKLHRQKYERDVKASEPVKVQQSGGAFESISNFFQNIGKKRSDKKEKTELTLPDIDQNGGRLTAGSNHSPRPPSTPRANKTTKDKPQLMCFTTEQIKTMFITAKETDNWLDLMNIFGSTFQSFENVDEFFKRKEKDTDSDDSELNIQHDLVDLVYEILKKAPTDTQKIVLKQIVGCLMSDKRISEASRARVNVGLPELRAYFIFSLNPLFHNVTTYVIFAHLLRQIASVSDQGHHHMVNWYKNLPVDQFRALVQKLNKFISLRLFPANPAELPPLSKCQWWIPSCCKVLALLNAANYLKEPALIPHTDFYNETLDNVDLIREYRCWQKPENGGFSFCQYPFLLSIVAKRFILQKDSEEQMINQARRTIVAQVQQRQAPELEALFLCLNVRRKFLVTDSLSEIAKNKLDLKKKLKVTFIGEAGLDLGGLTKEWFLLLVRELFRPEYGMFVFNKSSSCYWFCLKNREAKLKEFNLIGVLMGLAVYNGINLDIKLPYTIYKKLLSPAVVPQNTQTATVGVLMQPTLRDLESVMPDVAQSLNELLEYTGDVENDLCLTFQASIGQESEVITEDLVKGGEDVAVTNENRQQYIDLYLDWVINKSILSVFRAFYHGFHSVCASNALLTLKPIEIEVLVCGSPILDFEELRKICQYDGYHDKDPNIRDFWDILSKLSEKGQKSLLRFITGSDRLPATGLMDMEFKIVRTNNPKKLPVAHTCFNHLVLPAYNNKKLMQEKLIMAITNTEGFGLE